MLSFVSLAFLLHCVSVLGFLDVNVDFLPPAQALASALSDNVDKVPTIIRPVVHDIIKVLNKAIASAESGSLNIGNSLSDFGAELRSIVLLTLDKTDKMRENSINESGEISAEIIRKFEDILSVLLKQASHLIDNNVDKVEKGFREALDLAHQFNEEIEKKYERTLSAAQLLSIFICSLFFVFLIVYYGGNVEEISLILTVFAVFSSFSDYHFIATIILLSNSIMIFFKGNRRKGYFVILYAALAITLDPYAKSALCSLDILVYSGRDFSYCRYDYQYSNLK